MIQPRPYQQDAIDQLCKDAARGFDSRGRVLVPSKELAEQNLEKLVLLGTGLRIGILSAVAWKIRRKAAA